MRILNNMAMFNLKRFRVIYVLAILIIGFTSCKKDFDLEETEVIFEPTAYNIEVPYGFPTKMNIPADNPMTVEGIELGRNLFYDGRLSGREEADQQMSCATCHRQESSFEAGINHPDFVKGQPVGLSGKETPHVMLPMINLVWNTSGYGWNGYLSLKNPDEDFRNIEDFVRLSVLSEHEINGDTSEVVNLFQSLDGYPQMFEKAFGSSTITFKNIERAIAQFVRTLISANSKFDKYLRGEQQLTQSEINGFVLFTTEEGADCFHCHGGGGNPLFTTNLFYNNGKEILTNDPLDRLSISNDPMDYGAYKATTLRNIELQGPYMHDGRFETLDEVIEFYSHSVIMTPVINPLMHHVNDNGVQLTPNEKIDLKAFLHTLYDEEFITNPKFGEPSQFPDEK